MLICVFVFRSLLLFFWGFLARFLCFYILILSPPPISKSITNDFKWRGRGGRRIAFCCLPCIKNWGKIVFIFALLFGWTFGKRNLKLPFFQFLHSHLCFDYSTRIIDSFLHLFAEVSFNLIFVHLKTTCLAFVSCSCCVRVQVRTFSWVNAITESKVWLSDIPLCLFLSVLCSCCPYSEILGFNMAFRLYFSPGKYYSYSDYRR